MCQLWQTKLYRVHRTRPGAVRLPRISDGLYSVQDCPKHSVGSDKRVLIFNRKIRMLYLTFYLIIKILTRKGSISVLPFARLVTTLSSNLHNDKVTTQ